MRSDWVAPTLGPKLRTAAEAPEAVAAPLTGVCAAARAYLASDGAALLSHPDLATRQPALHLLASSFWAEVVDFITQEMPQVFGAGIPDAFQRNYLLLARLQSEVEGRLHGAEQLQGLPRGAAHRGVGKAVVAAHLLPAARQTHHRGARRRAAAAPRPSPPQTTPRRPRRRRRASRRPRRRCGRRRRRRRQRRSARRSLPTSTSLPCRRG